MAVVLLRMLSVVVSIQISYLLVCPKGPSPWLIIIGINVEFSSFANARIGLWPTGLGVIVCVIVLEGFRFGIVADIAAVLKITAQ